MFSFSASHAAEGEPALRLTVYTDFSLRVLMFLALKGGELATIAEIAAAYGISKNHLMKVVHQLGLAGYVETVRGKGGGMRLARRPEDIVIGEVVKHTESETALVPCFSPSDAHCTILPSCVLRDALSKAQRAFLSALNKYTLADLARPRTSLRKLLSVGQRGKSATHALRSAQRA
jgi:Rrf2 family nitric oxide-sensitive transcriptional repressor